MHEVTAVQDGALPPSSDQRLRFVFYPIATVGIIVSLVLGVRAVHDRPDLVVSDARVRREGLVATVQVTVRNRSHASLCPTIQIAARNRGGLDIEELPGQPVSGTGTISAGQTVGFRVQFTDLTTADYERLDKFVGFVESQHPC